MKRRVVRVIQSRIEDLQIGDVVNRDPDATRGWFKVHSTSVLFDGKLQASDESEQMAISGLHKDIVGVQVVEELEVDQYGRVVPDAPQMPTGMPMGMAPYPYGYAMPQQMPQPQMPQQQMPPMQQMPQQQMPPQQAPASQAPAQQVSQPQQTPPPAPLPAPAQAAATPAPAAASAPAPAPAQAAATPAPAAASAPSPAPEPEPDQAPAEGDEAIPEFEPANKVDLGKVLNLLEQLDAPEQAAPIRVELEEGPPGVEQQPAPAGNGDEPLRRLSAADVTADNARAVDGGALPDTPSYKNPVVVSDSATKVLPKRRSAA